MAQGAGTPNDPTVTKPESRWPWLRARYKALFEAAPMTCLVGTIAITVIALWMVGYIGTEDKDEVVGEFVLALQKGGETTIESENLAARRGGLAVSGILFAATVVLSVTVCFWAYLNRPDPDRWNALTLWRRWGVLVTGLVAAAAAAGWPFALFGAKVSFASGLAIRLLGITAAQFDHPCRLSLVPYLMLLQGVVVPVILAFSACLFISPLPVPTPKVEARRFIVEKLKPRIRELDQMLYLGALALVCGTLQLAAALSIPLARMPSMADVKNTIDMCKTAGLGDKSNPFLSPRPPMGAVCAASGAGASAGLCASSAASVPAPVAGTAPGAFASAANAAAEGSKKQFHRDFSAADCEQVQTELTRVNLAQSVRSLIHSLTLAIGLAFSMLLAAIYVPAMIRMRELADKARQNIRDHKDPKQSVSAELGERVKRAIGALFGIGNAPDAAATSDAEGEGAEEVDADPTRRITTALATLSPVIASLVANTLSQG